MPKRSAGLLVYRFHTEHGLQILLVHPGGPFFIRKDDGVWSIPKGEYDDHEVPLEVAKRELQEETGNIITAEKFIPLTPVKIKSGKIITAWAVEADFERCFICSNEFPLEWPSKSGKLQNFPEVDKADWFDIETARKKMYTSQWPFLDELEKIVKAHQ